MVSAALIRVAVLGAGSVGGQVARSLLSGFGHGPVRFELAAIAVRDVRAARERGLPEHLLTDAPAHLVAAADTDVIVELLGGDEPAHTLIAAALESGKSVVTANKHVVAHHGPTLEAIARRTGAVIRFEAAVGGGIPVLGPLASDLAANRVQSVRGIVNGTTNFILTAMAAGEGTYEAVLRDAQQRGYAEADPTGDVEGRDAANKLVILARLAFGRWADPNSIDNRPPSLRGDGPPGITGVTADELNAAGALGLAVRLLATADAQGRTAVVPTAVPADSPLGRTGGVRNRIEVVAEPVGEVGFDGPGAGGAATSSAVLGDLVAIARGAGSIWDGRPPADEGTDAGSVPAGGSTLADETRRWFALLPGVRAGRVVRRVAETHVETPAGVAIRTGWTTGTALASEIREVAPDTLDATLYPIDD